MAQTVFKRYEIKYILTSTQKEELLQILSHHMVPDKHSPSTIRNIYYDTDNYRLIRHSIQKPIYKEKLRLRCYQQATPDASIFVELKKKFDGIVYKRRLSMPEEEAMDWIKTGKSPTENSQIANEIDYFINFYRTLQPAVYLSYHRQAFYGRNDPNFRVTFDQDIRFRQTELSLTAEPGGTLILPEGLVLMEVKTATAIPRWMTDFLTANKIYKTSFSKYGTAYTAFICKQQEGDITHA